MKATSTDSDSVGSRLPSAVATARSCGDLRLGAGGESQQVVGAGAVRLTLGVAGPGVAAGLQRTQYLRREQVRAGRGDVPLFDQVAAPALLGRPQEPRFGQLADVVVDLLPPLTEPACDLGRRGSAPRLLEDTQAERVEQHPGASGGLDTLDGGGWGTHDRNYCTDRNICQKMRAPGDVVPLGLRLGRGIDGPGMELPIGVDWRWFQLTPEWRNW